MFRTKPGTTASSSTSAASSSAATVIQGSIRPPGAPPPDYTRQQHLDSYLQDDTLSKSTRRVSTGETEGGGLLARDGSRCIVVVEAVPYLGGTRSPTISCLMSRVSCLPSSRSLLQPPPSSLPIISLPHSTHRRLHVRHSLPNSRSMDTHFAGAFAPTQQCCFDLCATPRHDIGWDQSTTQLARFAYASRRICTH